MPEDKRVVSATPLQVPNTVNVYISREMKEQILAVAATQTDTIESDGKLMYIHPTVGAIFREAFDRWYQEVTRGEKVS